MLILNQLRNKTINLDAVESIEIDYRPGNAYGIKAVMGREWMEDDLCQYRYFESSVRIGEYSTSEIAKSVISAIAQAYASSVLVFHMPTEDDL